jgi:hypothetical protein
MSIGRSASTIARNEKKELQELQNGPPFKCLPTTSIALESRYSSNTPVLQYSSTPILQYSSCNSYHLGTRRVHERVTVTCDPEFRSIAPDCQINELPLERIKCDNRIKSFWS